MGDTKARNSDLLLATKILNAAVDYPHDLHPDIAAGIIAKHMQPERDAAEAMREALETIAKAIYCSGPDCPWCDVGEHEPSYEAVIAKEALAAYDKATGWPPSVLEHPTAIQEMNAVSKKLNDKLDSMAGKEKAPESEDPEAQRRS